MAIMLRIKGIHILMLAGAAIVVFLVGLLLSAEMQELSGISSNIPLDPAYHYALFAFALTIVLLGALVINILLPVARILSLILAYGLSGAWSWLIIPYTLDLAYSVLNVPAAVPGGIFVPVIFACVVVLSTATYLWLANCLAKLIASEKFRKAIFRI